MMVSEITVLSVSVFVRVIPMHFSNHLTIIHEVWSDRYAIASHKRHTF